MVTLTIPQRNRKAQASNYNPRQLRKKELLWVGFEPTICSLGPTTELPGLLSRLRLKILRTTTQRQLFYGRVNVQRQTSSKCATGGLPPVHVARSEFSSPARGARWGMILVRRPPPEPRRWCPCQKAGDGPAGGPAPGGNSQNAS